MSFAFPGVETVSCIFKPPAATVPFCEALKVFRSFLSWLFLLSRATPTFRRLLYSFATPTPRSLLSFRDGCKRAGNSGDFLAGCRRLKSCQVLWRFVWFCFQAASSVLFSRVQNFLVDCTSKQSIEKRGQNGSLYREHPFFRRFGVSSLTRLGKTGSSF